MFPRVTDVKYKDKVYQYLRVVESYRDRRGRVRQRIVWKVGRVDKLLEEGKLDKLVGELRKFCKKKFVVAGEIENEESVRWGPLLVARRLWEELELDRIISRLCGGGRLKFDVAERAFVLVASRLTEPRSEHGLARFLESNWVCDSRGVRYVPKWRPEHQVTKSRRVKVEWKQLNIWYRTLDAVYAKKEEMERELFLKLRDLFSLKVDIVFYDITSLSFAGREEKGELKRHGYPRGGSPRDVQVLLGMVMVGGFPIAGHVFRGNVADKTTVQDVVQDIERRFGIQHIIFVADKGMVSQHNLLALVHHRYILGHKGRRDKDAERWLSTLTDKWRDCSEGVGVQEVESGEEGVRVFIVESEARKEYEERLRKRSMNRAERHLRKIAEAVEQGRLKSKETIAVRTDRALHKSKGYRYFSYNMPSDGHFEYFLDEEKMKAELLREGRYIVTTNHPHISPREAVARYKELSDIEAGFREFKDIIQGRPIYHQREDRIGAHLFIAQLALLLFRQLRFHLDQKKVLLSPREALAAVKSIGIAQLDLQGHQELLVSRPKPDARQVLTALGITDLQPPGSTPRNPPSPARAKAM